MQETRRKDETVSYDALLYLEIMKKFNRKTVYTRVT